MITVAGVMLTRRAETLARRTGLGEALVGAALLGAITSLSGVVTSVTAAVEGKAALSFSNAVGGIAAQTLFLALAVGGIIGGNTFDVLFLSAGDISYREGSIYHAVGPGETAWVVLAMAMTALLLMGLIRREKQGVGGIGFEGAGILILYFGGAAAIALSG